ncbi:unnamed protein product [Lactuca virosa]|uniref:DUF4283 domain-containing protein n=1 Tax=Lactuca virosa TaxID=75947 RepID=A0AAU9P1R0_9ASTR|nr:unnamed protein product [Lactuca virosa]
MGSRRFFEKPMHDRVPVWVNIFGIPLQLFNKDGLSLIASKLGKPLEVDSYTSTMCEWATSRAIYARATSSTLRVEYYWLPKRCAHCKKFGHDHATCPACVTSNSGPEHTASTPIQKTTMPIPKAVDHEGCHTVKRRTRASHFPKKKVQVGNHKCKKPALKIAQVYKPIVRDPRKKNVSTNMFDALSHQRVDDNVDDPSIPPVILSRDSIPASDAQTSSSPGGLTSIPVDQG